MSRGFNVEKSNFSKNINPLLVYVGQVMFFSLKFVLTNLPSYIFSQLTNYLLKNVAVETVKNFFLNLT